MKLKLILIGLAIVASSAWCALTNEPVIKVGRDMPTSDIFVCSTNPETVMTVNGINSDGDWKRPKSTNGVVVELWTADGRHWRAQWVEVK